MQIDGSEELLKVATFQMQASLHRFQERTGMKPSKLSLFSNQSECQNMFLLKVCKAIALFNDQINYVDITNDIYQMELAVFLDTVLLCFLENSPASSPRHMRKPESSPNTHNDSFSSLTSTESSSGANSSDLSRSNSSSSDEDVSMRDDSLSSVDADLLEFLGDEDFST